MHVPKLCRLCVTVFHPNVPYSTSAISSQLVYSAISSQLLYGTQYNWASEDGWRVGIKKGTEMNWNLD